MKKLFILFALLSSFSFAFSQDSYLTPYNTGHLLYIQNNTVTKTIGEECVMIFGDGLELTNNGILRMYGPLNRQLWTIEDGELTCSAVARENNITLNAPLKGGEYLLLNSTDTNIKYYLHNDNAGSLFLFKHNISSNTRMVIWGVVTSSSNEFEYEYAPNFVSGESFHNPNAYEDYQVRLNKDGQMQLVGGRYDTETFPQQFITQAILWSSDFVGFVRNFDTGGDYYAHINTFGELEVKFNTYSSSGVITQSETLWNHARNYGQKTFVNDLSTQKNGGVLPRTPLEKNRSYIVSKPTKTCVASLSGNHLILEKLYLDNNTSTPPRTTIWESPDSWLPEGEIASRFTIYSWGNDGVAKRLRSSGSDSSEPITFGPNAANLWNGYSDPKLVVEETANSCRLRFDVLNLNGNVRTTLFDTDSPNLAPPKPRDPDQAILEIGEELNLGDGEQDRDRLSSYNGVFEFVLQENGIAQLINKSRDGCVKWQPTNQAAERFVFKSNGDLVLVNEAGAEIWGAGQAGKEGVKLVMQDDGNLVIYNAAGRATWATGTVDPVIEGVDTGADIYVGDVIEKGSGLISDSKMIKAIFQGDGNFVIYQTLNDCNAKSTVLFHIGLQPDAGRLELTERGLIMYRTNSVDQEIWKLVPTGEHAGKIVARGRLQNTGHFVLYDAEDKIIATVGNTGNPIYEMPTGIIIPPVEPIDLFNTEDGPSQVGFNEPVAVMVSDDGQCKLMQDESGYAMYNYAEKSYPVFETGKQYFSTVMAENNAYMGIKGLYVEKEVAGVKTLVWEGNGVGDITKTPYNMYLLSAAQETNEAIKAADNDNCILKGVSSDGHVNWTDEMGGVATELFENPDNLPNYYRERDVNLFKGMISTDGKCKVAFDATEGGSGLALFHYGAKEVPIFQTGVELFTFPHLDENYNLQNVPTTNGAHGVRILSASAGGNVWGGNVISTAVGKPMKLYVMSREEVDTNVFGLDEGVMNTLLDDPSSGDNDGCLLFNYADFDSETPRVIWTEELGGRVFEPVTTPPQARVSQVLDIYPNPPQGILNLVSNESFTSYQVVDLQSRVLLSSQFTETNQTQVDVTILKQGQYRAIIYKDGRPIDSKAFNIE